MKTIKGAALALALACAVGAYAQNAATGAPPMPPGPTPEMKAQHMANLAVLLDLTEAQQAQVQTVLDAEHAQMKAAMEQAHASGTKPDWQQMKAMHEKMQQETLQKLSTVLSATQLKKLQALQALHPPGVPHMHGPPPGAPPPQ